MIEVQTLSVLPFWDNPKLNRIAEDRIIQVNPKHIESTTILNRSIGKMKSGKETTVWFGFYETTREFETIVDVGVRTFAKITMCSGEAHYITMGCYNKLVEIL